MRGKPRRDSERCSIVNRTVSFNIEDPFQAQLLEFVSQWTNFSGTVKRLLAAEMGGRSVPAPVHQYAPAAPVVPVEMDDFDPVAELL